MNKFWPHLLPGHFGNDSLENISIDVAHKGCFKDFNTLACVKNSSLAFLGIVTFFLCVARIVKLHSFHHPDVPQYLIFYLASCETLLLFLKWVALTTVPQLEFASFYLKSLQFIVICYFFWCLVSRNLHRKKIMTWGIIPLLALYFVVVTTVFVMAMFTSMSMWVECLAPHWLVLSGADLLPLQLYVVAGLFITVNVNSRASEDSFRWEQKKDLWSVIIVYAISSFTSLVYYSYLRDAGSFEIGCSGVFNHQQEIYAPLYAVYMVFKYFLPIWIMLSVFFPTRGGGLPIGDGSFLVSESTKSTFCPCSQFRNPLQHLLDIPFHFDSSSGLRRTNSSPALFTSPSKAAEEQSLLPPYGHEYESYGATDSAFVQTEVVLHPPVSHSRYRQDSREPPRNKKSKQKVLVSLNQCSEEVENVTSSGERA